MYAIIDESGKQFKVSTGDTIDIDRNATGEEKTVTFNRVLLVGGEGAAKIGDPVVAGASVTAEIVGPVKGKKIEVIKYRRRKGYHKHIGHRQKYLRVRITGINA
jgi:large subunit ribosomal protein L21